MMSTRSQRMAVLYLNGIVSRDQVLNEKTLPKVVMPNRGGFVMGLAPRHQIAPVNSMTTQEDFQRAINEIEAATHSPRLGGPRLAFLKDRCPSKRLPPATMGTSAGSIWIEKCNARVQGIGRADCVCSLLNLGA